MASQTHPEKRHDRQLRPGTRRYGDQGLVSVLPLAIAIARKHVARADGNDAVPYRYRRTGMSTTPRSAELQAWFDKRADKRMEERERRDRIHGIVMLAVLLAPLALALAAVVDVLTR